MPTVSDKRSGLILILPGIDGWSLFNRGIEPGLRAGGIACRIEFFDWTRGFLHLLGNLRDPILHDDQAQLLAHRIHTFRAAHPGEPLWLIGHSGGAALSLLTLARISGTTTVTGAILLAPAISRQFDVAASLAACERGIWNFRSWADPVLLAATRLLGNLDGRRSLSAGIGGFSESDLQHSTSRLHDMPWTPAMLADIHLGGHFGCVNPRFIRRRVAPLIADT